MSGLAGAIASLDRNTRRYFAMYGLVMGGYFGITGVLLNLYLLRLGFGGPFIGTINGLSLAASAVMSTPAGALGRRFGSRSTILAGLLLSGTGAAVVPAAGSLPATLVAAGIVVGSLLFFAGGALYAANWAPYLMEIIDEGDRPRMFSLRSAVQPLATFAGSLAAGVLPRGVSGVMGRPLSDPLPYRLSLVCVPVMMLLAFLSMRGTDRTARPRAAMQGPAQAGRFPLFALLPLAGSAMLRQGSIWVARSFYNVYMDRELRTPTTLIGTVAAIGQLAAVPASLLMPALVRRWGKPVTIVVGTLGIAAGFVVMMALSMMGYAAFELFQQELVAPEWRPVLSGVCLGGNMVGSAAMVLSSGLLLARLGFRGIFMIGASVSLSSALLFAAFYVRGPRPAPPTATPATRPPAR